MVWISFILFSVTSLFAAEPPRFLTKHSLDSIRYISLDGRFAYVKKRAGVLGLVSYFKSTDILSVAAPNDFVVTASKDRQRVAIEVLRNYHSEPNFYKNNRIYVANYGDTKTKEVAYGRNVKLHLLDEWMTFHDANKKSIVVLNLVTQKRYEILLSDKNNAFFVPEVVMVNAETVVYTDINEKGLSAVIGYNLLTGKSLVMNKATQNGTRMEVCKGSDYLAMGEFPYDGVSRGSQILQVRLTSGINLSSFTTLYSTVDPDVGNMVCLDQSLYFVKTMNQNRALGIKTTEAVKLDVRNQKIEVKTSLESVTQLLEMDGRVLVPMRGEFFVLEGEANLSTDTLKSGTPSAAEELPLEI